MIAMILLLILKECCTDTGHYFNNDTAEAVMMQVLKILTKLPLISLHSSVFKFCVMCNLLLRHMAGSDGNNNKVFYLTCQKFSSYSNTK